MAIAKIEREMAASGRGCLGKAADDEPVFILRAQDKLAGAIVELWAALAEEHGCGEAKVFEARQLATKMLNWPTRKFPD